MHSVRNGLSVIWLAYALSLPAGHRPQTTWIHLSLSSASVFSSCSWNLITYIFFTRSFFRVLGCPFLCGLALLLPLEHRPQSTVSIQVFLMLLPSSSSNCTWILLSTFLLPSLFFTWFWSLFSYMALQCPLQCLFTDIALSSRHTSKPVHVLSLLWSSVPSWLAISCYFSYHYTGVPQYLMILPVWNDVSSFHDRKMTLSHSPVILVNCTCRSVFQLPLEFSNCMRVAVMWLATDDEPHCGVMLTCWCWPSTSTFCQQELSDPA